MAEQPKNTNSDEIDLGQLFQMIRRGFNRLGIAFLHVFLYFKKKAFILGGLILLGLGIGYGLSIITEEDKKIEVIVKPNLDSENYLYDVVAEIESNLKAKDTVFFKSIGLPLQNFDGLEIAVEPIEVEIDRRGDLELFEKFKDNPEFSSIIRHELLKNSAYNHRIIFTFKTNEVGQRFAEKVMAYINSTEFFKQLITISNENAVTRIEENKQLIEQIDLLLKKYTDNIGEENNQLSGGTITLDNEKPLNITGLLSMKNSLIQNIEQKKIELANQVEPIKVLNFGKPQKVIKSFFGKKLVLLPILLIGFFFIGSSLQYLNKKSLQIHQK